MSKDQPIFFRVSYPLDLVALILQQYAFENGHLPSTVEGMIPSHGCVIQFAEGVAELVFPYPTPQTVDKRLRNFVTPKAERNAAIVARHDQGVTFEELGKDYEISRERVRQIYNRETKGASK